MAAVSFHQFKKKMLENTAEGPSYYALEETAYVPDQNLKVIPKIMIKDRSKYFHL